MPLIEEKISISHRKEEARPLYCNHIGYIGHGDCDYMEDDHQGEEEAD